MKLTPRQAVAAFRVALAERCALPPASYCPSALGYQLEVADLFSHFRDAHGVVRDLPSGKGETCMAVRDDTRLWRGFKGSDVPDIRQVAEALLTDEERRFLALEANGSAADIRRTLGLTSSQYHSRCRSINAKIKRAAGMR